MNMRRFYEEYIYRVSGTISFAAALSLFLNHLLGLGLNVWFILFSVLFFAAFTVLFDFFKKKAVLYIVAGAVIIALAVLLRFFPEPVSAVAESFKWLFYSRNPADENAPVYAALSFEMLLMPLVAIVFVLVGLRCVRYGLGAAVTAGVIVSAVLEYHTSRLVVFFAFMILLSVFSEIIIKRKIAVTHLLPFILITGLLISVLPSKPEPIDWKPVKLLFESAINAVVKLSENIYFTFSEKGGEFGINMSGYSENSLLKNKLSASGDAALEVNTHKDAQNIYLIGSIADTYTGSGWTNSRADTNGSADYPEYAADALELMLALYRADALNFNEDEDDKIYDIIAVREMRIKYAGVRTRSLFYPLKSAFLSVNHKADLNGMSMYFDRIREDPTSYKLYYIEVNYGNEIIGALLRNGGGYDGFDPEPALLADYFNRLPGANLPDIKIPDNFAEILSLRKKAIYEQYASLPDTVPERVYELAKEITADCAGDYEKMKAIERHFSGFSYTLSPPEIPANEDFTDWFLFEAKNGYCTYFATAAAVMGRSLGIPVRYVQGYAVKPDKSATVVKNNNAHAWTEAYIDGIGWIPFEPTPTYAATRYGEWKTKPPDYGGADEEINFPVNIGGADDAEEETIEDSGKRVYADLIFAALGITAIAAAVVITGVYMSFRKLKNRYKDADVKKRFMLNFKSILFLLDLNGKSLRAGETLRAFSKRIEDGEFDGIVSAHELLIYKNAAVEADFTDSAAVYRDKLYKNVSRTDKMKYIFYNLKG